VIFDTGGVLILSTNKKNNDVRNFGVHEYISKKLNLSMDQWFDSIDSVYVAAIEGRVTEKKFLNTIARNVKMTPKQLEALLISAYRKNFTQNKELYEFAFNLKKQGYKIAILSDQHYTSKKALIPKKYSKKFDVVVASCDAGVRKPNQEIYKIILKKLKIPAQNCIFIDNQTWNLTPAQNLGMKTILFRNNKQLFRELSKLKINV
jgi:epoxide hydrolase-like predicted phosphatase